jgi:iron(III) transport system substrate-binding protein
MGKANATTLPSKEVEIAERKGAPMSIKSALQNRRGLLTIMSSSALTALIASLLATGASMAAASPVTVAEIALYRGADREQMLIEGAKKEGQVVFYNINTWLSNVAQAFEKKYPFIKVMVWRSDSKSLLRRVSDEYASGRYLVDVIDITHGGMAIFQKQRMFQEYYSPEIAAYGDDVKIKGKTGVYSLGDLELYIGLGFNTKLISPTDAPRTLEDLLDPKWKGRMSVAGTTTGVQWIGNALNVMGREYVEKLGRQNIRVQKISGAALAGLIVSGEVPLSPTIYESNIITLKRKGAPVEWRALEPVITNLGSSGITTQAPHPHAALLFLDYFHSKEGQRVVMKGGLGSPRDDVGSTERKFKKTYLEAQYSVEELQNKFNEWQRLMTQLFIRKQ